MYFPRKTDYALRALFQIARHGCIRVYPLARVAESEGISKEYLDRILWKLRDAGIVVAARGARGGYRLAKAPRDITIGEILVALGGMRVRDARGATRRVWQDVLAACQKKSLADYL